MGIQWEYQKIALNNLPRRRDDIDILCEAGEAEWELVVILPNNIAYLKRERHDYARVETPAAVHEERTSEVKDKYRDPATGETWSGRGRMATWLKRKQDAGEDIDMYLAK